MTAAWYFLLISAAASVHVVVGYPAMLALRRRNIRPVAKDLNFTCGVSVVMAVHNGAAMIDRKLKALTALNYPPELLEIIVISDGSTDDTDAIVQAFGDARVRLLRLRHGGKSAALNRGFAVARGEFLFFTDVRQPLEPDCLRHLVANLADPNVGAVSGEMRLLAGERGEQRDMDLYWRYEVWARTRHSEIDSLFNTTGCIYAMRRSLALPLPADTLTDDAVLPLRAFFKGYRVVFEPEAIAYDYPAVAGTEFRRRFRTLAGLWQVFGRLPELFTSKNRMRFHFVSHKFGRLVLPWAILVFMSSTVALPRSVLRNFLLLAEGGWLLMALINGFIAPRFPLKRLTSPASTSLVMNVAAMAAIVVFFVPAVRLWAPTKTDEADSRGR